jgi:hypothetical protein
MPCRTSAAVSDRAMRLLIPFLAFFLLAGCSRSGTVVTVGGEDATTAAGRLGPQQLAAGLDALAARVRERIAAAGDRIDEGAANDVRRRTLRFRLRAAEVTWRAQHHPNRLAGLIELWFWMVAIDRYAQGPGVAAALGERAAILRVLARTLREDAEDLAQRALPPRGYAAMRERIANAAASGEILVASPQQERAVIDQLLEATQLQTVLGLALAPFEALRGIGSGGDAAAAIAVSIARAVDLLERYPELAAWNLRLAVIDLEEQDTAREARAALQRLMTLADELPQRLRREAAALLDAAAPALPQAQAALHEAAGAAKAMTELSESAQRTLAAVKQLQGPPAAGATAEPARPFDIREYTAALAAAEKALREARGALDAATATGLPAADEAVQRLEGATNRILINLSLLLAFAAVLAAGLIYLRHRLRR